MAADIIRSTILQTLAVKLIFNATCVNEFHWKSDGKEIFVKEGVNYQAVQKAFCHEHFSNGEVECAGLFKTDET